MNLWCKLWNFVLDMFVGAVDAIAYALKTVGTVLLGTAEALLSAAGSAISSVFSSSPIVWIAVAAGAYLLLGKKKDDKKPVGMTVVNLAKELATDGA